VLPASLAIGALEEGGHRFTFVEQPLLGPRAAEVLSKIFAAGLPVADVSTEAAKLEDILLRVLREGAPS
jgi:hypothetical protein